MLTQELESIDCSCVQEYFIHPLAGLSLDFWYPLFILRYIILQFSFAINGSIVPKIISRRGLFAVVRPSSSLVCHGFALRLNLFHFLDNINPSKFRFLSASVEENCVVVWTGF